MGNQRQSEAISATWHADHGVERDVCSGSYRLKTGKKIGMAHAVVMASGLVLKIP